MKTEERIEETRTKLKNALTELLLRKPLESISIKEIAETAGINRSTFYAHYTCPRDLIDEMEDDIISHLPVFSSSDHVDMAKTFTSFMSYIKDNRNTVMVLMSNGTDSTFGEKLIKVIMDRYDSFLTFGDEELERMSYIFCINGIVGIVRDWIESGCVCPVEKVAGYSIEMAMSASSGRKVLRPKN